ncbi:MAG: META domain-containing protein [Candidatus Pacebacteria bacterium]|nr:META domain-containing protein [Candidatus Paceibacterota bacterium]
MKKILMSVIIIVVFIAVVYMVVSKGERKDLGNNLQENNIVNNNTNGDVIYPTVVGNVWKWQGIIMSDDTTIVPAKPGVFTLTFSQEGQVSGTTDCNSFSGTYSVGEDGLVTWGAFASTKMFCENSQESVFLDKVANVDRIFFDEAGNLILLLKFDSGAIVFSK